MNVEAVIANAAPFMAFSKLNILHLLKALYGEVQFTRAVYDEVVTEGMHRGHEDAYTLHRFLAQEGWQTVIVETLPEDLAGVSLDRGELESIAWALAINGLLLMDEEKGRAVARRHGIATRERWVCSFRPTTPISSPPISCVSTSVKSPSDPTSGSAPPYASDYCAKFWRQRVDDSDRIDRR